MYRSIILFVFFCGTLCFAHLNVVYKWRTVEFEFPDNATREKYIRSEEYIPGTNALPLDVDVYNQGNEQLVFVTFPKFRKGIPATLATISDQKKGECHLITPFPDLSWNSQANCDGMTSVFRTQIDSCGRLWAIDSGMVDLSLPTRRCQCPPKLLAFQLPNRNLVGTYTFPDDVLNQNSLLTNLAVDVRNNHNECQDTFVYVSDTMGYALIVLDVKRSKSWKVQSNSMYPYPPYGLFQTNNVEFNLMDGVLGMALSPSEKGEKTLYYHSLASVRESWVPTFVLKNENYYKTENSAYKQFRTSEEARKAQSAAEAFDKNGILYFGMVDNSLSCWNHRKPFTKENIHELSKDNTNLQFASGLKIIANRNNEEEIWLITNRFQITMVGQLNPSDVNFRILTGKVDDLLRNSQCRQEQSIFFPNKTAASEHTHSYSRPSAYSGTGYGKR